LRASTHKLLTFAQREQVSLNVFGHDENLWPALKKPQNSTTDLTFSACHSGLDIFSDLCRQHVPALLTHLRINLPSREDAEDVLLDVFGTTHRTSSVMV
jgi:hypothetical protein